MRRLVSLAAILLAACAASVPASPSASPPRAQFSFAAVTDIGVHRHGTEIAVSQAAEATRTFDWLRSALHERQVFPAVGVDAAPPDFLFVCGNVTENGAINEDWPCTERLLDGFDVPWYAAAGPQDMGWTPILEGFDKHFGGLVYSFDRGGAHFIALCSATACDWRPSFSPLQLNWLREDLARNDDRKPVFVFVHHGPGDHYGLSAVQMLELRAACDGHDVAAVFFAQGDGPEVRHVAGFDCVACNRIAPSPWSTYSEGSEDNRGYVSATIDSGKLCVVLRTIDGKAPRLLLEKMLRRRVRAPFSIEAPEPGAPARGGKVELAVRAPSGPPRLLLDGEPKAIVWKRDHDLWRAELTPEVEGGAHQLAVLCDDDGTERIATREFLAFSPDVQMLWRRAFAGSLHSAPVWAGEKLAIASTAGEIAVLEPESGELIWSARTAAVIGRPWGCADGGLVVADVKGWVEAFDGKGVRRWRFQAGHPVLVDLAGDDESVFAVDAQGKVHALDLLTGAHRWTSAGPGNPEDPPIPDAGRLILVGGGAPRIAGDVRRGLQRTFDARTGQVLGSSMIDLEARLPRSEAGGRIAELGARGTVDLRDAANGSPLWTWRVTASGFVFAPPLLRADGTVWIAGMDGALSCVRAR